MEMLTKAKVNLLNSNQIKIVESYIDSCEEIELILLDEKGRLVFKGFNTINALYDYMLNNDYVLEFVEKINDTRSFKIFEILDTLISLEEQQEKKHIQVLINVYEMLNKYDGYVIQYYINTLPVFPVVDEYHSSRNLFEFIELLKKDHRKMFTFNTLIKDACMYAINNDLDLKDILNC